MVINKYKQLNLEEQVTIKVLLQQSKSNCYIGLSIGKTSLTIEA